MNMMGLRFLLKGGAFLDIIVPEMEAISILDQWANGEWVAKGIRIVVGFSEAVPPATKQLKWAISVDDIIMIHTAEVRQHPKHPPGIWESGRN